MASLLQSGTSYYLDVDGDLYKISYPRYMSLLTGLPISHFEQQLGSVPCPFCEGLISQGLVAYMTQDMCLHTAHSEGVE